MAQYYWCNQQTLLTSHIRDAVCFAAPDAEHKASMPPFNCRDPAIMTTEPPLWTTYNVPVFGVKIPATVMNRVLTPEVRTIAAELQLPLPHNELDPFLQSKAPKIRLLVSAAQLRDDCGEAVIRLSNFVDEFEALDGESISSPDAWDEWIRQFLLIPAKEDWRDRLHFDHVLSLFGFSRAAADALRSNVKPKPKPKPKL